MDKKRGYLILFALGILTLSSAVYAQGTGNSNIDWGAVSVVVVIIGGIVGWVTTKREKNKVAGLMTKIDSEYSSFKLKPKQCENELYKLRNVVSDEFKKGKIDSSSYSILDKRIDDYLIELRERIADDMFEGMPQNLREKLSGALEDGVMSEKDVNALTGFMHTTNMSEKKKAQFERMIKDWKNEDSGEAKQEEKGIMWKWVSKIPWTRNRIAIFSFIVAGLLLIGGLAALGNGNPGGIVLILFGILTLAGGINLRKKKPSGIKMLKIAYWILLIFWVLMFLGEGNPVSIIAVPLAISILYHLKHIHTGAS